MDIAIWHVFRHLYETTYVETGYFAILIENTPLLYVNFRNNYLTNVAGSNYKNKQIMATFNNKPNLE